MPELPEVETVRRQLSQEIVGEKIVKIEVRERRCWRGVKRGLKGSEIVKVERKGKYLLVWLSSGKGLIIHLRMTGRVIVNKEWYETAKHTRVVMEFASRRKLYYWSTRMFGYIEVVKEMSRAVEKLKEKLGFDPWEMSEEEWKKRLKKTTQKIKSAILDQKLIAGVGNIYANDALWLAGIRPQKRADKLTGKERKKLLKAIRTVMERGLELNGASDNSYLDAYGEEGTYQNEFLVYGKTKGECKKCGEKMRYDKVGGRGTWWCRHCQK